MSEQLFKGVLVATLEPVCTGAVHSALPAHITVLPPFLIPRRDLEGFCSGLQEEMECWIGGIVRGQFIDGFGSDGSISVRRLFSFNAPIIHGFALAVAAAYKADFDETYTGINDWHGHVTDYDELEEGQTFQLEQVSLWRKHPFGREVVRTFYGLTTERTGRL